MTSTSTSRKTSKEIQAEIDAIQRQFKAQLEVHVRQIDALTREFVATRKLEISEEQKQVDEGEAKYCIGVLGAVFVKNVLPFMNNDDVRAAMKVNKLVEQFQLHDHCCARHGIKTLVDPAQLGVHVREQADGGKNNLSCFNPKCEGCLRARISASLTERIKSLRTMRIEGRDTVSVADALKNHKGETVHVSLFPAGHRPAKTSGESVPSHDFVMERIKNLDIHSSDPVASALKNLNTANVGGDRAVKTSGESVPFFDHDFVMERIKNLDIHSSDPAASALKNM